jgi:glycosyltransferase involved in cell wall biosynthesis
VNVSVVIPVYNSEEIIPELLTQIAAALKDEAYEIVLVNDGSADKSWETIESLISVHRHVKGICLAKNFGQDNAIMCGLHYAVGEYVIIMDDDLQHSPKDIVGLIRKCEEGFDVCYADYSSGKRQSWWKNIGSFVNTKQAEVLLGKPRGTYLSPFKAIRRSVVESMLKYSGPFPYIDGLIFRSTSSITQVSVEHHDRFANQGNYNFRRSVSVFLSHLTGFSIIPLRIASLMGVLLTTAGLVLLGYYVKIYFDGEVMIEGWTTLVLLQLTLGGAILMSLGVIGEYVGRLYLLANNRPQFVVRKVVQ